jgi:hypothetical protein
MRDFKIVNRDEMLEFVSSYNETLERIVNATYEPPLITYNDFTLGNWPESVVAYYTMGDRDGEPEYYGPESGHSILDQ